VGVKHLIIPDTQVRPGVPTDHLKWIGQYALEKRPEKIIHIGDHYDMPSLSHYDRGKLQAEGRRYKDDIVAGNKGFTALDQSTTWHNQRARKADNGYFPEKHYLMGNHENRIARAIESDPKLEGAIGFDDFDTRDWIVHHFLDVLVLDGIAYSHYFYNPMTGRAYGGVVATRLKTLGHSFVMGHQQVFDYAERTTGAGRQMGLVCGTGYLHDEAYLGPQGNGYWRGIVMLHEVENGYGDLMKVSFDYLCKKYEGLPLLDFLAMKYVKPTNPFDDWIER
jgi:hypothetical protein